MQIAGESLYASLLEARTDIRTYAVTFDPDVIAVLDRHLDDDHHHSTSLGPADWAERGLVQRAAEKGRRERLAVIDAVRLRPIADRMRHSLSFIPTL